MKIYVPVNAVMLLIVDDDAILTEIGSRLGYTVRMA